MEPLRKRGGIVSFLLVAILVVTPPAVISNIMLLRYLQDIAAGGPVDEARAEFIDTVQAILGLAQLVLFVSCAIAFLMWIHRAHKNLKAAGIVGLEYTPGWAVGGFFVPFLNLVRPFQVMKEIWAGSEYLSADPRPKIWRSVPPSPLVGWWWALFLVTSFLGNASGRLMLRADELGELIAAGWVTLFSDLADIPSSILAILVVRRVTGFQEDARTRSAGNAGQTGGSRGL